MLRFQRELKTPSTTFRYPSNLLHLRNALLSHPQIQNPRHRRNHNYSLFIFHHSSFIIFADNPAIPTITATLHYPSPRTIKNQNPRRRRHHNSSFFIIHHSSFILHFPPSPAAPRSPSRSPPRRPASFFRPIHTRTCS